MRWSRWVSGRRVALVAGVLLPCAAALLVLVRANGSVAAPVTTPSVSPVAQQAGRPAAPRDLGETVRLRSAGQARAILVQPPLTPGPARALLLALGPHGLTARQAASDMVFDDLRRQGWAVAFPSALAGDWNAGGCCGASRDGRVDDVRFLRDARSLLQRRFAVPDAGVVAVGYSTGGQMLYRTLCTDPTYARAAVIVSGSLETDCAPAGRLPPTLIVHGLEDTTVPWAFTLRQTRWLDFAPRPALSSIGAYASAAGCSDQVLDRRDGRWLIGWHTCTNTDLLSVAGMPGVGHGWQSLHATTYAQRFLPRFVH